QPGAAVLGYCFAGDGDHGEDFPLAAKVAKTEQLTTVLGDQLVGNALVALVLEEYFYGTVDRVRARLGNCWYNPGQLVLESPLDFLRLGPRTSAGLTAMLFAVLAPTKVLSAPTRL